MNTTKEEATGPKPIMISSSFSIVDKDEVYTDAIESVCTTDDAYGRDIALTLEDTYSLLHCSDTLAGIRAINWVEAGVKEEELSTCHDSVADSLKITKPHEVMAYVSGDFVIVVDDYHLELLWTAFKSSIKDEFDLTKDWPNYESSYGEGFCSYVMNRAISLGESTFFRGLMDFGWGKYIALQQKQPICLANGVLDEMVGQRFSISGMLDKIFALTRVKVWYEDVDESGLVSDYNFIIYSVSKRDPLFDVYYLNIPIGEEDVLITEVGYDAS